MTTRRRFLKVGGVVGISTLAGCSSRSPAYPQDMRIPPIISNLSNGGSKVRFIPDKDTVGVLIDVKNIDHTKAEIFLGAYSYTGELLDYHRSDKIELDTNNVRFSNSLTTYFRDFMGIEVDVPLGTEEANKPYTYVCQLIPKVNEEFSVSNAIYLGETIPLKTDGNRITRTTAPNQLAGVSRNESQFSRIVFRSNYEISYAFDELDYLMFDNFPISILHHHLIRDKDSTIVTKPYDYSKNSPYGKLLNSVITEEYRKEGSMEFNDEAKAFEKARVFSQSIPYYYDRVMLSKGEYPKYPIETLVSGGGDCEDTTVLLSSMLEQEPFNYDTIMIFPETHAALGVALEDLPVTPEGNYMAKYEGKKYVYVESTAVEPPGVNVNGDFRALYGDRGWKRIQAGKIVSDITDGIHSDED